MNNLAKESLDEQSWLIDLGPKRCLESKLALGQRDECVVICPPHPLFGGTLDNAVVKLLRDTCWEAGYGTLRFNYRGVGQSSGGYGGGDGEAEDLRALLAALAQRTPAPQGVHLAGYSFGAWIALKACADGWSPRSLLLVAPPVDSLNFAGLSLPQAPCSIATGEHDDLCSPASLRAWLRSQEPSVPQPRLKVLADCDHFFDMELAELRTVVLGFLAR